MLHSIVPQKVMGKMTKASKKWSRLDIKLVINSSVSLAGNLENIKNEMTKLEEHIASCDMTSNNVLLRVLFT